MEINDMVNCLIELKKKIRNEGKTNIITTMELDRLFIEYDINLKELEKIKNGN